MKNFFDHMRDGVSQSERQLEALWPTYIKIDGRTQEDLLMFLADLAAQFNYYDFNNEIAGDWTDFFSADMIILLMGISRLDFTTYQHQQLDIQSQLQSSATEAQLYAPLSAFFNLMYGIAIQLTARLQRLKTADQEGDSWNYADQLTESMGQDIYQLLLYEKQALGLFSQPVTLRSQPISQGLQQLFAPLLLQAAATPDDGTVFLGYQSLQEIYNSLRSKFYQVSSSAQFYLDRKPADTRHHPHIGLIMAFTELYGHLQERINDVTRRHLDYYYQTVLGIARRPAVPDRVHIFFNLLPQSVPLLVPPGAQMEATINKTIITYTLEEEVKVSHAQIRALQTVFAGSRRQISAASLQETDIRETQVFTATHEILPPAAYAPGAPPVQPWALMGEEQHDLPAEQRTMQDTDLGFIIASAAFYLPEGYRTVQLSVYFESTSFNAMEAYIKNYAKVVNRRYETVFSDLLSAAFVLSYTTATGWENIPRYNIKSIGEGCVVINFVLDITDPGTAIYNPLLHGDQYETAQPLLKVLLNNNSFHHPSSFMNHLRIERMSVNAQVKGYRSVKLYNNIGPLSPVNPFQLFGPQPAIGSYLQIRDSNVFNKFTKDFRIQLEWLELPVIDTGFDAYYAAYDAGITNSSFKVGLSALGNGQYIPERGKQQSFTLFETERRDDGRVYLSDTSTLEAVDFQKINFNNRPLLDAELLANETFFTEGAVRLELIAPDEAFGQRLYTQLFPEIVTHNTGRWVKKRPIPNAPHTPLVKAISIDYTLEQSEILKADKTAGGLQLIHLYPFGYKQVYPLSGQSDFFLLPQLEDSVNLYMGFENLQPQEQLNIFFQLEEKHFGQTTRQLPQIKWSYLYNDVWIPFDASNMLTDTTHQFINSGIVSLKMPSVNCYGNTRLDAQFQWLRVSAPGAMDTRPMVKGIFLHGGIAVRTDGAGQLPSGAIKSLQKEIRGIQQLWQLFPSFDGRPEETAAQYNVRVSERLRHKDRPMLGIDLIQLVLDAFPEILIAKCIGQDDESDNDLQLVVVPRQADGTFESEEPRADLATLYRIKDYVDSKLPPFIKISVNNPVYEKIKICCDICFIKEGNGTNNNYYLGKLQEDVKRYLNPWLYDPTSDLKIGSILYKSEILNFIKRLPYVAYVTAFSLVHFFSERDLVTRRHIHCALDTAVDDIAYLQGTVPEAVLIPATNHGFNVIDEWTYRDPQPMGISSVITGQEMIVGRNAQPDKDQLAAPYPEGEMITLTIQSNKLYGDK